MEFTNFAYNFIDIPTHNEQLNALASLALDTNRELYTAVYGRISHLPRIFTYDPALKAYVDQLALPQLLSTRAYSDDRALYTTVMSQPIHSSMQQGQAEQYLNLLKQSCVPGAHQNAYRALAHLAGQTYLCNAMQPTEAIRQQNIGLCADIAQAIHTEDFATAAHSMQIVQQELQAAGGPYAQQSPFVEAFIAQHVVAAPLITDMHAGPLLIEPTYNLTASTLTDFVTTPAHDYKPGDYVLCKHLVDSPFRQELLNTFSLIGQICTQTHGQMSDLLRYGLRYPSMQMKQQINRSRLQEHEPVRYDVKERATKFCSAVNHLVHALTTVDPEFTKQIKGLMSQGNIPAAATAVLDATVGQVMRHMIDNLANPLTFMLQTTQGVLQTANFAKDALVEPMLDMYRSPEEYHTAMQARLDQWDNFVQSMHDMPADQVKEAACKLAADLLTLEGLAKAARFANRPKAYSAAMIQADAEFIARGVDVTEVHMPRDAYRVAQVLEGDGLHPTVEIIERVGQAKHVAQQELTFAPAVSASSCAQIAPLADTVDTHASHAASSAPVKRNVARFTQMPPAATKQLDAMIKPIGKQQKSKYSQPCDEHGMPTTKGVHEYLEIQPELKALIPDHLANEILAKPYDHTMHTHVHPMLPESFIGKSLVFDYEHLSPVFEIRCAKGEVSAKGFHHDRLSAIEKSGLIQIKDKIVSPLGCYGYEWASQGSKFKSSTFFPAEWTRVQVVEKISESLKPENTQRIFYKDGDKYRHLGLTSEGIPVLSVIKVEGNIAKVITAYPDFIEYGKFLRGEI